MIQYDLNKQNLVAWLARVCLLSLLLMAPADAAEVAARVQFVVGNLLAIAQDGDSRRLRKGDEVFSGDTLESGSQSSAQLLFSDSSRMAVRSNTILRVEDYHYDANNRDDSNSIIALLQGAVRSITGLIGNYNKHAVMLVTPVATIGIRGTDHETVHVTRDFNDGNSAALTGTYNKVYSGGTVLQSARGSLLLDASQVGFVAGPPGDAEKPILIDALPAEIDELLVKKLPLQQDVNWARTIDDESVLNGALTTGSTLLDLTGDAAEKLTSRLEATTSSLLNSLDSGLEGDLAGALGGQLSALPGAQPIPSGVTGSLSTDGLTTSPPGLGGGTALPLAGSSLESITTPVKLETLSLPGL